MNRWLPVAAYLVGSFPTAYLLTRVQLGLDVRRLGSGNPGATNVLRVLGRWQGAVVLAVDAGKGMLAVAAGWLLGASPALLGAVALAAVLGHVFPPWLGFRGGKGVATGLGVFAPLAPLPTLMAATVFVLVLVWKRFVALASIAAAASLPGWLWVTLRSGWMAPRDAALLPFALAVSLVVVVRHAENVRRMLSGEEDRLGEELETPAP